MSGLRAGDLDREITLQKATLSQDAETGEELADWTAVDSETVWAQWLAAGTTEAYRAQQRLEGTIDGIFRIYWRDDISAKLTRIVWDGKTFDVRPPIEGGRQEFLDVPVAARAD